MPLTIDDDLLDRIELSEDQLRLEIAVMLRDRDKLDWRPAARLAGVDLGTFLDVLQDRGVPMVHIGGTTAEEAREYLAQDAVLSEFPPDGSAFAPDAAAFAAPTQTPGGPPGGLDVDAAPATAPCGAAA